MEDRIARALNQLGEDTDLLSADMDGLLDLLDDYLDDDPLGKTPPNTHLKIDYYTTTTTKDTTTQHHTVNDELNLMGQIMAHCSPSPSAPSPSASPAEKREVHTPIKFFHAGLRVCQPTFLFLHTIGIHRFKNIKTSYLRNGPAARVHGNKERKPKKTLTLQEVNDVVQYILNYTGIKYYGNS